MTPKVQLVGPWPEGFEAEVQLLVANNAILRRETASVRGSISWGDIAALISSAAAVASVGVSIWAAKRGGKDAPLDNTKDLTERVRGNGVYGVRVLSVRTHASNDAQLSVAILDETSGGTHRFAVMLDEEGLSVAIERDPAAP